MKNDINLKWFYLKGWYEIKFIKDVMMEKIEKKINKNFVNIFLIGKVLDIEF